jgi:hypothetical protein
MLNVFFPKFFISGLKDEIQSQVLMTRNPTWLEDNQRAKEAQQVVFSHNKIPPFVPHPRPANPNPLVTPLKVQKLTRDEMYERQPKGLFYNCDEKYFLGHKCKEQKLFMAISKYVEENVTVPLVEEPSLPDSTQETVDPPEVDQLISLHTLTGFSPPQTLKHIGYIKNMKVIIIVDSGITHTFIHCCIS